MDGVLCVVPVTPLQGGYGGVGETAEEVYKDVSEATVDVGLNQRSTRMLPGLKSITYRERSAKLALFNLERRRMRSGLMEVYKIRRNIERSQMVRVFYTGCICQILVAII